MIAPELLQDDAPPQSPKQLQLKARYDGIAKVTGKAKYAVEFPVKDPAYRCGGRRLTRTGNICSKPPKDFVQTGARKARLPQDGWARHAHRSSRAANQQTANAATSQPRLPSPR
jgi:hypothetical protein